MSVASKPASPTTDAKSQAAGNAHDLPLQTGPWRVVLLVLGWMFVGLAAVGVVLPILPTTPFLLVAAACFAKSSPRFYHWLLDNRIFGPMIRSWRESRTIPRRAKISALTVIGIVGGFTAVFVLEKLWMRAAFVATLLSVGLWILRVPSERAERHDSA